MLQKLQGITDQFRNANPLWARRRGKLVYKLRYEPGIPRMQIRRVNIMAFWVMTSRSLVSEQSAASIFNYIMKMVAVYSSEILVRVSTYQTTW
jgi:hypothetical protein